MTIHYISVLKSMFGDGWKQGAEMVKAWGEKIDRMKVKT